jgi:glycosyltransferase involved in cell wall biosynthesis
VPADRLREQVAMSAARPLRLTLFTDSAIVAGSERLLIGLVGGLGPDVEVTVVGVHRGVVETVAAARPGTRFALVPKIRTKADLRAMLRFARTVAAARPDVLQLTLTTPWSCRAETFIGLVLRGVRTVLYETLPLEPSHKWTRFVARVLARRADARVAVGVRAAREVEHQVGLPHGSVRTIESAVEEFEIARHGPRDRARPRIGTIARLDHQKGLDVLLRALPDVPDVDVEIVGEGPERAALEALADAVGVADRVTFAGWSEQAPEWLGRWDAFVLPSRYEGLPLAMLEAMLAELPVVAADVGSVREAVEDGVTGVLVPPEDAPALAAALRRVLEEPARARELGRHARAVALERFTARAMARRFEALYQELLSR